MQPLIENTALPVINSNEISNLHKPNHGRYSAVKRALKNNELIQLRRRLYILNERYRREKINLFEIANHMYEQSYVSLESALSFHGLIPEAVYKITSASLLRSRTFINPLGEFVNECVRCDPFFDGVKRIEIGNGRGFLIAEAERALCDLEFVRKIKWSGRDLLEEGFRIELEDLQKLSPEKLNRIASRFKSGGVKAFMPKFVKEVF